MRVTSGKSRVRESRMPGSVRAEPYGRATRPRSRTRPANSSRATLCLQRGALLISVASFPQDNFLRLRTLMHLLLCISDRRVRRAAPARPLRSRDPKFSRQQQFLAVLPHSKGDEKGN